LTAVDETPLASICYLSRLTYLSSATVHRWLTQSLGYITCHFRQVPHILPDDQKAQRVEQSRVLFQQLEAGHNRAWHDIVMPDELWFLFTMSHEFIWLPDGEKVPQRERPMIWSKSPCSQVFGIPKDSI
jgi:hypothetical protein